MILTGFEHCQAFKVSFLFEVKDFNFHTNLRSSFIQVEGFDIKQDAGLNFYFKFIFEFMCNFQNFSLGILATHFGDLLASHVRTYVIQC